MKNTLVILSLVIGLCFASCNNSTTTCNTDSLCKDSVCVDSCKKDSIKKDTTVVKPVKVEKK